MLSISIYLGYLDVLCAASKDVVFVQMPGCLFPYGTPISSRPGWWTMGLGDVPLGGSEGHRNGEMLAPGQQWALFNVIKPYISGGSFGRLTSHDFCLDGGKVCCGEVTPLKVNAEPDFFCPLDKESPFGKHHSQVPS